MKATRITWAFLLISLCLAHGDSVSFTKLHSFNGADGAYPISTLVQGNDGNFYGTTQSGGADYTGINQSGYSTGSGTVFKITPEGVFTTLVSFNGTNGWNPDELFQARDGDFYGTTGNGGITNNANFPYGWGTIFRMTLAGNLTNLVLFNGNNGAIPSGSLIQAINGDILGTTTYGGTTYLNSANSLFGNGTVFKIQTNGGHVTLHSFSQQLPPSYTNTDGSFPDHGVIQGQDGNLYGTTRSGGAYGEGTVFKLTPGGVMTTLASLGGTNGWNPAGGLLQSSDGNLYGTTQQGPNNFSTIFRITTNGAFNTLYVFTNGVLVDPSGLIQSGDGNFYGTTYHGGANGHGSVFQMTASNVVTVLHSFTAGEGGAKPIANLVQGANGTFYGTTQYSGNTNTSAEGYGTVFRITISPSVPVKPPVITQPLLSRTLSAGADTLLSFALTGDGPFSYQWRLNSSPIPGATNPTLNLVGVTPADAGRYEIAVTGPGGAVTSAPASVALFGMQLIPSGGAPLPLLILDGAAGTQYRLETSPNISFSNWSLLSPVTLPTARFYYADTASSNQPARFYRAVPQ